MVVEIRPGEGGDDAEVFASELADVVVSVCRRESTEIALRSTGRTLVLDIGSHVSKVEMLVGTHRIQRVPSNSKRRHTSTATVVVLDPDRPPDLVLDESEVRIRTKRGTGPGGQHRNVTDSAVEVLHRPTGIVVQIDSGRSQHQNKDRALGVLADRLTRIERAQAKRDRNASRREQVTNAERPSKDWTWNVQRGEVLCHSSGKRYDLGRFRQGRF
ncbi:peptide chain release factor-like protein [Ferrimicrobium sp.]|uniref:peptide chain release factor-like protein n=1 Tax=Ferrimicrobium sp. TaxID=2926050 RepID=UPI0034DB025B